MRYIFTAALTFVLMSATAHASPIIFTDVSGTGTFQTGYGGSLTTPGDLSLLTDGTFPVERSSWQSPATISFNQWGSAYDREYFTFDMGSLFTVDDIIISADNNDSYTIEYSIDNTNWLDLVTADRSFGEQNSGMDTLSSISGDSEYVFGLDFAQSGPAQYLRIYVDGFGMSSVGDGAYAVGEFQAFGEAYDDGSTAPIPVPATMFLFGIGLMGLVGVSRKKQ